MPTARFSDSRYYLSYSVSAGSQSIPNNTTSVATGLSITKDGSASGWSNSASYWYTGYPTSASSSFTYDFRSSNYLALYSTSTTVGHNSDGTKSFSTSASVNADTPLGSAAIGAFTVTLPTIPRATIPTVSPSSAVTGQPLTINTVPANSGFTHNISYVFGSISGTIATGAGSSTSWTPPHSLLTEIPNAPSGTLQIMVQTKSGTTDIGSLQTLNVTLTAGADQVPTISTVAWAETNTIIQTNIGTGIYVQGRSILRATITAAGIQGSTITAANKKMIVDGVSYADLALVPINKSGTVTATAEVTDSRGRVASKPANITVLPYQPPRLGAGAYTITRANNLYIADPTGNYGYITIHSLADSLKNGATEKNQQTIVVSTRQRGTTTWVTRRVVNGGLAFNGQINLDGTGGYGGGAIFDGDKSYDVLIQVYDNTEVYPPVGTNKTPIHIEEVLPTTKVALDIYGSRLGVGKMVEDGTLDVLGDTYTSGNFYGGPAKKLVLLRDSVAGSDITSGTVPAARLPLATAATRGAVLLATQAEVNAGTDNSKYVSPLTLRNVPAVAFMARLSSNFVHTGAAQYNAIMPFDFMLANSGNAYNPATYTFTAPYDGVYNFTTTLLTSNATTGPVQSIYKNDVLYRQNASMGYNLSYATFGFDVFITLVAGDTIKLYNTNANITNNTFPSAYANYYCGSYVGKHTV